MALYRILPDFERRVNGNTFQIIPQKKKKKETEEALSSSFYEVTVT